MVYPNEEKFPKITIHIIFLNYSLVNINNKLFFKVICKLEVMCYY